jgi:hypothetical protein
MTQKEAFVYWHRAAGTPYKTIAKRLNLTESYARSLYYAAVAKSKAAGVSFVRKVEPKQEQPKASSSFELVEIIKPTEVKPRGFAALKALADEIAQETAKSKKNIR